MFCMHCGNRINDGERFCTHCGTAAAPASAPASGATVTPVSAQPPTPSPAVVAAAAPPPETPQSTSDVPVVSAPPPAARPATPEPPFRMFGVEMRAAEPGAIAPSSGEPPVTVGSPGMGVGFWVAAVLVVVAVGVAAWFAWSLVAGGNASGVTVRIEPATIHVAPGATASLSAYVSGDPESAVKWSVIEGPNGGYVRSTGVVASNGHIGASAEYTAPGQPGTYHVLATSEKDEKQASSAEVVVQ